MSDNQEVFSNIKAILKANPHGATVTDIAREIKLNRNSASKYLEVMMVAGQVEMKMQGPSKVYYLSQRIPISETLGYTSDMAIVFDSSLKVVLANENFARLAGKPLEALTGLTIAELDLGKIIDNRSLEDALNGKEVSGEIAYGEGTSGCFLKCRYVPTVFDDGHTGVVLILENITRQHQMEEEINRAHTELANVSYELQQQIEERKGMEKMIRRKYSEMDTIFKALPDIYFRVRTDGTVLHYFASKCHDLYTSPDQFLGRKIQDVMPEEIGRKFNEAVREILKTGSMAFIEYTLPIGNVEETYEARLLPLTDDDQLAVIVRNITERKKTEERIRVSEEKFYRAFHANPCGIMISSLDDGRFIDVNESFTRITGYTREEVVDRKSLEINFFTEPTREEYTRRLAIDGRVENMDLVFRRKSGKSGYGRVSGEIITINRSPHIISVLDDVTMLKEAQMALKKSEEKYRIIVEMSGEGIAIVDEALSLTFLNPQMAAMLGYAVDEMLGRQLTDFMNGANDRITRAMVMRCKAGHTASVELQMQGKNGRKPWVAIAASPLVDDNGMSVGTLCMISDITRRKIVELELQEKESILSSFIDQSVDGIMLVDEDCNIIEYNRFMEKITGYSKEEVIGTPAWSFVARLIQEDETDRNWCETAKERFLNIVTLKDSPMFNRKFTRQIYRKDGARVAIQTSYFPVNMGKKFFVGCVNQEIVPETEEATVSLDARLPSD